MVQAVAEPFVVSEPGIAPSDWPKTDPADVFGVKSDTVPLDARPVFDDTQRVIVGWQWESGNGFRLVATPDGRVVSRVEKGMEHPLIDPIDIVLIIGSFLRILGRGAARGGALLLESRAARLLAVKELSEETASVLIRHSEATARIPLLFTKTVLGHMANPKRFVPVQIIKMAIAHGARSPDPRGVAGLFRYFIKMTRNGKDFGLEVILRDSDQTVVHVLYSKDIAS